MPRLRFALFMMGALVIVLLIGGLLWARFRDPGDGREITSPLLPRGTTTTTPTPQGAPRTTPDPWSRDRDQDGLLDEEEARLKTNPENPDSDGDGRSDFQEVYVYKTNPLLADRPSPRRAPTGAPTVSGNP